MARKRGAGSIRTFAGAWRHWREALHPRDKQGRFIDVPDWYVPAAQRHRQHAPKVETVHTWGSTEPWRNVGPKHFTEPRLGDWRAAGWTGASVEIVGSTDPRWSNYYIDPSMPSDMYARLDREGNVYLTPAFWDLTPEERRHVLYRAAANAAYLDAGDLAEVEMVREGQEYRGMHRPTAGPPVNDLLRGGIIPDDIYDHPEWYGSAPGEPWHAETVAALNELRGKPDDTPVTIYRATPGDSINPGDWVTLSREYALQHAKHPTDPAQDLPVIEATVPASAVRFAGDDLSEWGYFPEIELNGFTGSNRITEEAYALLANGDAAYLDANYPGLAPLVRREAIAAGLPIDDGEIAPPVDGDRRFSFGEEPFIPERPTIPLDGEGYDEWRKAEEDWKAEVFSMAARGIITPDDAAALFILPGRREDWHPLPPKLFHVGTATAAIVEQGFKTRDQLGWDSGRGLGAGPSDVISFTDDEVIAGDIYSAMLEARAVAAGEITMTQIIDMDLGDAWGLGAGRVTETWMRNSLGMSDGLAALPDVLARYEDGPSDQSWDDYRNFIAYRASAGGPMDPLFMNTDWRALAEVDPADISILEVHPREGTFGQQMGSLSEWRVHPDAIPREVADVRRPVVEDERLVPRRTVYRGIEAGYYSLEDFNAIAADPATWLAQSGMLQGALGEHWSGEMNVATIYARGGGWSANSGDFVFDRTIDDLDLEEGQTFGLGLVFQAEVAEGFIMEPGTATWESRFGASSGNPGVYERDHPENEFTIPNGSPVRITAVGIVGTDLETGSYIEEWVDLGDLESAVEAANAPDGQLFDTAPYGPELRSEFLTDLEHDKLGRNYGEDFKARVMAERRALSHPPLVTMTAQAEDRGEDFPEFFEEYQYEVLRHFEEFGHDYEDENGDVIDVAVQIVGLEVDEASIEISFEFVTSDGDVVGRSDRTLRLWDGSVYHDLLELDEAVQGKGIGYAWNRHNDAWYVANGLTSIGVSAGLDEGGYQWASDFFTMDDGRRRSFLQNIETAARTTITDGNATASEITSALQAIHDIEAARDSGHELSAWEIAHLGYHPAVISDRSWIARKVMRGSSWHGEKDLVELMERAGVDTSDMEIPSVGSYGGNARSDWHPYWSNYESPEDTGGELADWVSRRLYEQLPGDPGFEDVEENDDNSITFVSGNTVFIPEGGLISKLVYADASDLTVEESIGIGTVLAGLVQRGDAYNVTMKLGEDGEVVQRMVLDGIRENVDSRIGPRNLEDIEFEFEEGELVIKTAGSFVPDNALFKTLTVGSTLSDRFDAEHLGYPGAGFLSAPLEADIPEDVDAGRRWDFRDPDGEVAFSIMRGNGRNGVETLTFEPGSSLTDEDKRVIIRAVASPSSSHSGMVAIAFEGEAAEIVSTMAWPETERITRPDGSFVAMRGLGNAQNVSMRVPVGIAPWGSAWRNLATPEDPLLATLGTVPRISPSVRRTQDDSFAADFSLVPSDEGVEIDYDLAAEEVMVILNQVVTHRMNDHGWSEVTFELGDRPMASEVGQVVTQTLARNIRDFNPAEGFATWSDDGTLKFDLTKMNRPPEWAPERYKIDGSRGDKGAAGRRLELVFDKWYRASHPDLGASAVPVSHSSALHVSTNDGDSDFPERPTLRGGPIVPLTEDNVLEGITSFTSFIEDYNQAQYDAGRITNETTPHLNDTFLGVRVVIPEGTMDHDALRRRLDDAEVWVVDSLTGGDPPMVSYYIGLPRGRAS